MTSEATATTTNDTRVQRARRRGPAAASYPAPSPLEDIKAYLPKNVSLPTSLPPWAQDPATVAALSASLAVLGTLGGVRVYRRFFKRIRNADSLSTAVLDKKPFIKGVVTRVGDGGECARLRRAAIRMVADVQTTSACTIPPGRFGDTRSSYAVCRPRRRVSGRAGHR